MTQEARKTTADAFSALRRTATPDQLEVLNALHKYIDHLHDMIDARRIP